MESRSRSLLKTFSYRVLSVLITFLVSLAITGNFQLSASIGALDGLIKVFPFYLHERTWNKINWGAKHSYA